MAHSYQKAAFSQSIDLLHYTSCLTENTSAFLRKMLFSPYPVRSLPSFQYGKEKLF